MSSRIAGIFGIGGESDRRSPMVSPVAIRIDEHEQATGKNVGGAVAAGSLDARLPMAGMQKIVI